MKPLHTITSTVIEGNKRGRLLGYPTANMQLEESLDEGVYVSEVVLNNQTFPAATFVGRSKTFDDYEYKLESFILDFDKDIYGETMTVHVYKHIRGNKKFSSEQELIEQMQKDVQEVRDYLKSHI
jgi:riboflavin kinase / FMN adenylyltransferase